MTFTYDSDSDYYFLKQLFNKANREFLLNDFDLLQSGVAEPTLCSALKSRLSVIIGVVLICISTQLLLRMRISRNTATFTHNFTSHSFSMFFSLQ